jgi:two-component system phosphate regulon response regulator PhoB
MAASSAERVLVVDDEPDLRGLLLFNLEEAGYAPLAASSGMEALSAVERERPALVLLDLMLPDIPGVEVCRRLRAAPESADLPIVMLTARGDEYDRLVGFEVGADDYVVKPFSVREVLMRVRALLRRHGEAPPSVAHTARWKALELDPLGHRLLADGNPLPLRPLEYRLAALFLLNPARLFTRAEILERVWESAEVGQRTVDTHVRRLREKLGEHGDAVETVSGFGYRLRDPA